MSRYAKANQTIDDLKAIVMNIDGKWVAKVEDEYAPNDPERWLFNSLAKVFEASIAAKIIVGVLVWSC